MGYNRQLEFPTDGYTMATEEELLDAQIKKTNAEADLAQEQLQELTRRNRMANRIGQGIGAGIVLALTGMVLFEPIVKVVNAKNELAEHDNLKLKRRLEEREKDLKIRTEEYGKSLIKLQEKLETTQKSLTDTRQEYEKLLATEKESNAKIKESENDQLSDKLKFSDERIKELEEVKRVLGEKIEQMAFTKSKVSDEIYQLQFRDYRIILGRNMNAAKEILTEFNIKFEEGASFCSASDNESEIIFYDESSLRNVESLVNLLEKSYPELTIVNRSNLELERYKNIINVCQRT